MLRDIITEHLRRAADIELIGELANGDSLLSTASSDPPDVAIVAWGGTEGAGDYSLLFHACPQIKVLAVTQQGREVFLHELRPHVTALGELSPQQLIDVIRASVRPRGKEG